MPDITTLLEITVAIGMLVVPPIVVSRLIAGRDGGSLADLLAMRAELPRPRGVQEDDPPAWRFELLASPSRETPARVNGIATCGARPARTRAAGA